MIITFVGHSKLYNCNNLSEKVRKAIIENTQDEDDIIFYCGGYGDFDNLCAKVCGLIKDRSSNCEVILVTPYISKSHQTDSTKNCMI